MNTRYESKISILNDPLVKIFGSELNLARIRFISLFIIALSKVQTVTFDKIAIAFENKAYVGFPEIRPFKNRVGQARSRVRIR